MNQIKGILSVLVVLVVSVVLTVGGSYVLKEFFDMPTIVSEFLGF